MKGETMVQLVTKTTKLYITVSIKILTYSIYRIIIRRLKVKAQSPPRQTVSSYTFD